MTFVEREDVVCPEPLCEHDDRCIRQSQVEAPELLQDLDRSLEVANVKRFEPINAVGDGIEQTHSRHRRNPRHQHVVEFSEHKRR